MRCIPETAECAVILIGSMKNLSRPIMAFVRLAQGQLISKSNRWLKCEKKKETPKPFVFSSQDEMTEVPLPLKFLFLLIGPAMDEYLEIGRSLSTLFSTLVNRIESK